MIERVNNMVQLCKVVNKTFQFINLNISINLKNHGIKVLIVGTVSPSKYKHML